MNKIALTAILLLFGFTNFTFSQSQEELILTRKYASNSFRDGNYEYALENYLILYELDKKNIELNYRIGICYTETNIDKEKAISHLEFVVSHNNYPIRSYFYLGKAYMFLYRFTEAIEAFYEFKMMGVDEVFLSEADRMIEMCYYALELINVPKNITFEHLDASINSEFDEYFPFVSADGQILLFTTNRVYVEDFEDYISNVFYSEERRGTWTSAQQLTVSTYDNEEIVGLTPDADKIMIHANGDYHSHDIKMVNRRGSKFTDVPKEELPADINSEGLEMGACISPDGNTIFFSSNRKGGRGGLDIYVAHKNENGQWQPAENLGTTINTVYDENFPSLSADGKKLYFASKGHQGIGGYDLFQSFYNEETKTWSPPINLGFPINTPSDNTTISFTKDGKTAYMSANRKEGFGKLDIYKIHFGDEAQQPGFVAGNVLIGTPSQNVPYSEDFLKAYATFFDTHGNIMGQFEVLSDGGQFFATLYPGTYRMEVKFSGAKTGFSENITVTPENANEPLFKTIYLKPNN